VHARDAFAGSLIGQCLGDALGFPVEGMSPAVCRDYVDGVLRAGRAGSLGRDPFPFGQYTDDSQLARELALSYAECGGFEPADFARRVAAIFVEDRIVGRGQTTEAAAQRLAAGVPWDRAGTPAPAAGNGAAMRAGPVGWMAFGPGGIDAAALLRIAVDQARVTHADPRCAAGAVAIAGAVALALDGAPFDSPDVVAQLATWTEPVDASFTDALRHLPDWLRLAPEAAGPEIARAGLQPGFSDRWDGISPFVTSSVLWSLYSVLRNPDDYWETICTAIAVGGDVDTTAAMAGAISGARLGLDAPPADLVRRLNDQGGWGQDQLIALAHRCHAVAQGAAADGPDTYGR
jgi:ADP-ribosylglycohydrolase